MNGETKKQSNTLTKEDIFKFLGTADEDDCYWLVREVALVLGYLGGTRVSELRALTQSSVKPHPEGYQVTFFPAKQTGHVKNSKFLVKNEENQSGVNCARILQKYLEALTRYEVVTTPDGPFFMRGYKKGPHSKSKFTNEPIGKNTLAKIPGEIAEFLNLPESEKYTGHCFRR